MVSSFSFKKELKAREQGVFIHGLSGQGEVVSVYSTAINILHPDKLLVSVVKNRAQMTALSILLPSFFRSSKTQESMVKPGDRAIFEESRLTINDLCIDLERGKTWEGSLGLEDVRGFRLSQIPLLREALLQKGKSGGLLGLIDPDEKENPFVRKASRIFGQVLIKGHGPPTIRGLSRLIGLGIGFTPSGDDFVSGVLLGERILNLLSPFQAKAFEMVQERITPCSIDRKGVWRALEKTTYGGRTLLWQALQGHFPYYLIEAARGLVDSNTVEEMMKMVGSAVSHGETSGTDALVGLFWYLNSVCLAPTSADFFDSVI